MTDAEIAMTIPAESRFVAIARVTTASIAAELDFGVDQIDELRVGANELVAALVEWAEDHECDRVELTYLMSADALQLTARADSPGAGGEDGADPLDELTRQILSAVVDEYEITAGRGRILKRRGSV